MKLPTLSKANAKAIKDLLLRLTFLICSGTLFLLFAYYIPRNTRYEYTDTVNHTEKSHKTTDITENMCTLILENGMLVVYSDDGKQRTVTDADTSSLTEYDIQLLSKGISACANEINEILGSLGS